MNTSSEHLLRPEVENKHKRISGITTAIIIALLLLLFMLLAFSKPEEKWPPAGLMVDFGYTETGTGPEEPKQEEIAEVQASQAANPQEVEEVKAVDNTNATEVKSSKEVVKKPAKKPVKDPQPTEEPKEEEKPFKAKEGTTFSGNSNNSNSSSQGWDGSDGNAGKPDGGKSDSPIGDNGAGYKLGGGIGGRGKSIAIPDRRYVKEAGQAVIRICVDQYGRVTETIVAQGTTVGADMQRLALDAAKRSQFTSDPGNLKACGTITYTLKLQ